MQSTISCISLIFAIIMMAGCNSQQYSIFQYDNGDDYICEGVRRIVDKRGKIGYADKKGGVIISPRFAFAFPFENGIAKATMSGFEMKEGEHSRWISPEWFYIDHHGNVINREPRYQQIEQLLKDYIADKDARVGIAVIVDEKDTISVNGNHDFPMMSVFKFPQALAVAEYCMRNNIRLSDSISIRAEEIKENTWSPMREKYGIRDMKLPVSELLDFILQESDNNASDILFRVIGGTSVADSLMKSFGYKDIEIAYTEDEMHRDTNLCYKNHATPIEMASLFNRFFNLGMSQDNTFHKHIGTSMITCRTGLDRLSAPLKSTGAVIAHKTGTGDTNSQGRIIAINDAGYVILPNRQGYSISVFIADSALDMKETSGMIAEISNLIFKSLN